MLELCPFVRSGGALDAVVLKPLHGDGGGVEETIRRLDISRADCYLREDRQRILSIVESSYGSSGQFNRACRDILQKAHGGGQGKHPAAVADLPPAGGKSGRRYHVAQVAPDEGT